MNDESNLQPDGNGGSRGEAGQAGRDVTQPMTETSAHEGVGVPLAPSEGERRRGESLSSDVVPEEGATGMEEFEPWPEPVDGSALLNDLERVLRRFVVLPKWATEALALWIVHTYAFELREVSTYIGIESPERRCGKTTLLGILEKLVNRPAATANISSPAFFRVIGEMRPTLMIDEADTFLKRNDALRGILNAGYTRETAFVVRMETTKTPNSRHQAPEKPQIPNSMASPPTASDGNAGAHVSNPRDPALSLSSSGGEGRGEEASIRDPSHPKSQRQRRNWTVARFSCWCPKVIALIGRLPGTLADRCIVIRMQRKLKTEECERMRKFESRPLRRKCQRFVADHRREIVAAQPEIPASLNDRAADIWEPLLVIADRAGGKWPVAARNAAEALSAGADGSNPIASLLMDIALVFAGRRNGRIFSEHLVLHLRLAVDRPWMELIKSGAVNERWLAQVLRPYGIRPRTMRIEDAQGKGYFIDDFKPVFHRYIPDSELRGAQEDLRQAAEAERELQAQAEAATQQVAEQAVEQPEAEDAPDDNPETNGED